MKVICPAVGGGGLFRGQGSYRGGNAVKSYSLYLTAGYLGTFTKLFCLISVNFFGSLSCVVVDRLQEGGLIGQLPGVRKGMRGVRVG